MRLWTVTVAVVLLSSGARAADDELPAGDSAPRPVVTGVADAYYAWHDVPPPDRQATALSTGSRHNEFSVNLGALGVRLEHAKLTGNLVVQFGDQVDRVYGDQRLRYIQLANVGWKTGIFHLEAGVMPGLVGHESFASTDNWNYTRSFVSDATPYFVTGARVTAFLTPTFKLGGTVFNGWDTYRRNTRSPHGQLFAHWQPSESFSIDATALFGPTPRAELEPPPGSDAASPLRAFGDVVLAWSPHARVDAALEGWISRELRSSAALGDATPMAYGGVLSLRWKFADTVWLAGRGEAVVDESGIFVGRGDRIGAPPGQKLLGGTFTFAWQPHPKFIGRVEALQRYATEDFFAGESGEIKKRSTTFVVSAAVAF